jgi:hypothetical protein
LNSAVSLVEEKIVTAPQHKYWVGASLAANSQFMKNLRNSNIGPSAAMVYPDEGPSGRLEPPTPNTLGIGAEEPTAIVDTYVGLISTALGDIGAEESPRGSTAEEVLYRRENQLAAYNKYIFSANIAAKHIASVIEDLLQIEVDVVGGPYESIKNQDVVQKIMSFAEYANNNPAYAALTIPYIDVPAEVQTQLAQSIEFNPQQMALDLQQAQELANTLAPQLEQAQQEAMDAQKALEDYRVQQQIEVERIRLDYEAKITKMQADFDEKVTLKQMDIEGKQQQAILESTLEAPVQVTGFIQSPTTTIP